MPERRCCRPLLPAYRLPLELATSTAIQKSMQHNALLEALSTSQRGEFKKLSDRFFHQSLDECHGKCLLRSPELANVVGDAISFFDDDKYDLDRFVVMPNHIHAIVQFRTGESLEVVSQSWMRYTARQINAATGCSGVFWQAEPFDHIIRGSEQFEYLQKYIFENPNKANLRNGEFLYWERPM